jgi:hypothetical protein
MARNNFLEQIKRARDAAEKPGEATERETKPTEQMTDAGEERRTLAGVLHEKQRGKRRTWR